MARILSTASYLGSVINTNGDVCDNIPGLEEKWIIEKTGIRQRRHRAAYETPSFMAGAVARKLVKDIDIEDLGLIIIASFSQDYMFPPMSVKIHSIIGASKDCQVIDLNTNCVGLVTATTMASEKMEADESINFAIVIGVEVLSDYIDKTDKFTAPFFSDGAGGVLLDRMETGYIGSSFCTDSSVYESVRLKRGGLIEHDGKETWTQAITNLPYVFKSLVSKFNLTLNDIDFFIFHQANKVLIDYIMDKNKIDRDKTYTNIEEIGNTGAASIGIALDEAMKKGLMKQGDRVILAGVGAGFNFGANLWIM